MTEREALLKKTLALAWSKSKRRVRTADQGRRPSCHGMIDRAVIDRIIARLHEVSGNAATKARRQYGNGTIRSHLEGMDAAYQFAIDIVREEANRG